MKGCFLVALFSQTLATVDRGLLVANRTKHPLEGELWIENTEILQLKATMALKIKFLACKSRVPIDDVLILIGSQHLLVKVG